MKKFFITLLIMIMILPLGVQAKSESFINFYNPLLNEISSGGGGQITDNSSNTHGGTGGSLDDNQNTSIPSLPEKPSNGNTSNGQHTSSSGGFGDDETPSMGCSQLQTIKWFQKMFDYVKILAPILVIILSAVDYTKSIFSSSEDSMKKTNSRFVKRVIAAVLLFILPALLSFILNLTGENFGNDLCGIK